MVLGRRQRDDRASVGDRQDAGFLPVESFFEDELPPGIAELAVHDDPLDGVEHVFASRADDHALAGGQPVGFDDQRHFLILVRVAVGDESLGALGVPEDVVVGRRHIGVAQQVLAEDLAAFELCGALEGPNTRSLAACNASTMPAASGASGPTTVSDDVVLFGELDQLREVGGTDRHIFRVFRRPGIARRYEHAFHARALRNLPRQGMFATTIAND